MTRIRETICLIFLLLSVDALATTPSDKQIDKIYNSTGGSQLSIPSSGSNLISDVFSSSGQVTLKLTDDYGGFHLQSTTGTGESSFALEPGPGYIGGAGQWIFYTNGSNLNNQNDFAFYDSELSTSVFIIQSATGFLGVGTNNPGYNLDVNGTLHSSNNVTLSGTANSVGTITSGTWNGATIGVGYGGTGSVATPSTGQLLIGNGSTYSTATPTQEYLSVQCNSSSTAFSLAHTPNVSALVSLYLDGTLLKQGSGYDYTISGSSITLATACATGQILYSIYTH